MSKGHTKYIFITGGVLSGVGKGITAASIGSILKARGLKVSIQKCDQYLNVDAGTLDPSEHGECFVTKDGAETDLDLGHYERFLDIELTSASSVMSGRVLRKVITDERAGQYSGKTVQIVPHVISAMQNYIKIAAEGSDVHIVEVGGTVGDIEGQAWIEAIRELGFKEGLTNCAYVHVVYIPFLGASKEFKTKPAQNAVKDLRNTGIVPNLLVGRSETQAPISVKDKLSLFSGVSKEAIALLPNARSVYKVPLSLESQGIGEQLVKHLSLSTGRLDMSHWVQLNKSIDAKKTTTVRVAIVAGYLDNEDTYFSVIEALRSAAWAKGVELVYDWIDAVSLTGKDTNTLTEYDGIIAPGDINVKGMEGMVEASNFALSSKVPYLGICLGLHAAVLAAARKGGLTSAQTVGVDPDCKYPVVKLIEDSTESRTDAAMRLGAHKSILVKDSLVGALYGELEVEERYRHTLEVNQKYAKYIHKGGVLFTGLSSKFSSIDFIEAADHPFFVATQSHPEFTSRPGRPHPLFEGFISALKEHVD